MSTHTAMEFLLWLLIAASAIAVIAARLKIPYTVALVIGGLILGSLHQLPLFAALMEGRTPNWLTPDVILILFLPALLFEGSIRIDVGHLWENLLPILLLAIVGVLAATLITGYAVHWTTGIPILIALLFGAIISATDPISVLSIFQEMAVASRLSLIVEAESLFNDGTGVVLFQILLVGIVSGRLGVLSGIGSFFVMVLGGAVLGALLGYVTTKITQRIDEPRIEITLTTILAYTSYLLAQSLHLSGVIATVAAGLVIGNFATKVGMKARTRVALWSFWDYAAFVMNSLVFLLIGMQVHIGNLLHGWGVTVLTIYAVLLGRVLSVYPLTAISNLFTEKIPLGWRHVLVWGGMRGSLALALVLSLPAGFPYRDQILAWTLGVVAFSLIVQGLTIRPLLSLLGLGRESESEYDLTRARHMAASAARSELDDLVSSHVISTPAYDRLRAEIDSRLESAKTESAEVLRKDRARAQEELAIARLHLKAAEQVAIQEAVHDGLISRDTGDRLIDEAALETNGSSESRETSESEAPPQGSSRS